jgi:hypothetical protein
LLTDPDGSIWPFITLILVAAGLSAAAVHFARLGRRRAATNTSWSRLFAVGAAIVTGVAYTASLLVSLYLIVLVIGGLWGWVFL